MSPAVFYVLAALIVLAAVAAVSVPTTRLVVLAALVGDVLVGVLLIAAGALLLGVVALVVPAACLYAVTWTLRRTGYAGLLADVPGRTAGWPLSAAIAAIVGVVLVWTAGRADDASVASPPGQGLLSVLHLQAPVSAGVGVVLAVVAVAGAFMIGRTGDDERVLDRATEQRRAREQRAQLRRDHRAAARARRGGTA